MMTALSGTSVIQRFLDFMSDQAGARSEAIQSGGDRASAEVVRRELDATLALALAAYAQIGELSREVAPMSGAVATSEPDVVTAIGEAYARYHEACGPVLRLIERARQLGVEPKRLTDFMGSVGEADLIAHHYDAVIESERQADAGRTRPMGEVRDELRRRLHPAGR